MACLVDTNVLVRLANTADAQYSQAANAVVELHRRGEVLHISPQILIEFRNVATRPISVNGLGLSTDDAEMKAADFEAQFGVLDDRPDIFPAWKDIVHCYAVAGKQVHDARLVAVCHVHSISHLLTFNVTHFARMSGYGNGLIIESPTTI